MALFLRSLILSRGSAQFFYYIAAQRCLIDISHADTRPNPLGLSWFFYWFRCRLSSHLSVPHFLTRSLAPPATQVAIRLDGGQCLGISQITKRDLEVNESKKLQNRKMEEIMTPAQIIQERRKFKMPQSTFRVLTLNGVTTVAATHEGT